MNIFRDHSNVKGHLVSKELILRSEKLIKNSKELIEDLEGQLLRCKAILSSSSLGEVSQFKL